MNEKTNIEIVYTLCDLLDELRPLADDSDTKSYRDFITYVKDRPGHDTRYAVDSTKIQTDLNWRPAETFESGIRKTVDWYLDNLDWVDEVISGDHHHLIKR